MKATKAAVVYVDGTRYSVKKGDELPGPVARAYPALGQAKPEPKKEDSK